MRMAAVRLMQVGLTVHVAGDATTPPIRSGDLLLIASGSGETSAPVGFARKAAAQGARVALITSQPASTLGSLADTVVFIPGGSTRENFGGTSKLPLAAALEQATLIVLDSVVAAVAERTGQTQSSLMARHANLE
jgi:6-phospho-3-hexuloisomerase